VYPDSFRLTDFILSTFRIAVHRHARKKEERTAFAETLFRQSSWENQTFVILSCPERI
jgi:hypothetical protein